MNNYFNQDENPSEEQELNSEGEIDMVQVLRRVRGLDNRQIKMIELVDLLFQRLETQKYSDYKQEMRIETENNQN